MLLNHDTNRDPMGTGHMGGTQNRGHVEVLIDEQLQNQISQPDKVCACVR